MKGMKFYKKAIDELCVPHADAEIGCKIGDDGLRRAAIFVSAGRDTCTGREIYTLSIDRALLNELAEEDE